MWLVRRWLLKVLVVIFPILCKVCQFAIVVIKIRAK